MMIDKLSYVNYTNSNIFRKGSLSMYLFVANKKSYNSNSAMSNNGHGLIAVCEYFSDEEK